MKNTTILILVGILIISGAWFVFGNKNTDNGNNPANGNVVINDIDAQKITLSTKNYNYYPNTITVKEGKPVEITLDKSVTGCLRSFNIKDLGVSKTARTPEDKIIFTPTKKGTFTFACSMGMGYGKIIVE
ncbi:cupredoxin domain-containing protein [Candidatus Pacearchaeota archaeon]|nr:cupredoxin domain-containing protein [Candidatus Pacearchaeota archaeon]